MSLAAHARMSRRTFARRFNDEVGLSPGRRLIQQRVARARDVVGAEVVLGVAVRRLLPAEDAVLGSGDARCIEEAELWFWITFSARATEGHRNRDHEQPRAVRRLGLPPAPRGHMQQRHVSHRRHET
ncbi:hypothetical protein STVIR_1897 [Streptomyces viridochromogenes Tue57]|uniref:HTH araC/xylS-type domain-containing protein n=1 Tax=Streptomyces viridochromogenes Tue57 TaxID=1160705 RepID=L8PM96_STRVR|nr:hypothetical protein STVIR_1897 [Streptomyces viridochromogenes Tue57]